MDEVGNLLSRRSTTFLGGHRRIMALVVISVAAAGAAWLTWRWVRDKEGLVNENPVSPTPKAVRFAPTVRVRLFNDHERPRIVQDQRNSRHARSPKPLQPILKT